MVSRGIKYVDLQNILGFYQVAQAKCTIFTKDIIIIIIIIHEYYYGGAVALLLQDHITMSVSRFAGYKTCPGVNSQGNTP